MGDSDIDRCSFYKYLGVYIDENLNFKKHDEMISKAAFRALGALIFKFKTMGNMGFDTFTKLFESNVVPILDYGSEIVGYASMPKCEQVQFRAMKSFLGTSRLTPHPMVEGDMGWIPGHIRRVGNMIRFWNRVQKLDRERLPKAAMDWELETDGKWSSFLKGKLDSIDKIDQMEDRSTIDLQEVQNGLFHNYKTIDWPTKVRSKPKLRTYLSWAPEFGTKRYVKLNLSRAQRSILARLRGGVTKLRIETGRFTRPKLPVEERVCLVCNNGAVENEEHFLVDCVQFSNTRKELLSKCFPRGAPEDKQELVIQLTAEHPRALAKCAIKMWEERQGILFKNTLPPTP